MDARKLYAREASPSMFAYCTRVLHLSEAEAYVRIAVARASRKHPLLLDMLADGRLHLTAIDKLAPHLTPENRDALLMRAAHLSKRQTEELIAELRPRPDARGVMRKLPGRRLRPAPTPLSPVSAPALELRPDPVQPMPTEEPSVASPPVPMPPVPTLPVSTPDFELRPDPVERRATVQPLAPARYKVQFTAGAELRDLLQRLQALMRSTVPDGDLAALIEIAVAEKVERLEARHFGRVKTPRKGLAQTDVSSSSRYIPAAVRRTVSERDGSQCHYVDGQGRRCPESGGLEYHHRHPYGLGGDRSPGNISILCRTHNAYLAEQDYGRKVIDRHRDSARSRSGG